MRAIFEELDNNIARLIPDDGGNPIEVKRCELPDQAVLGDVFEIYKYDQQIIEKIYLIPNERIRRLEKMKLKREALLRRTKDNR
jgi:hypothetical protein